MQSEQFVVLIVCTANLCRSPMAEHLLRVAMHTVVQEPPWVVRSAGSRARDGGPMHHHTAQVLSQFGISSQGWETSRLTPQRITAADLILTASAAHRKTVVTMVPASIGRTFPLLQFAALAEAVTTTGPARSGSELVARAISGRSRTAAAVDIDLADPVGRSVRHFQHCATVIQDAIDRIIRPLRPE